MELPLASLLSRLRLSEAGPPYFPFLEGGWGGSCLVSSRGYYFTGFWKPPGLRLLREVLTTIFPLERALTEVAIAAYSGFKLLELEVVMFLLVELESFYAMDDEDLTSAPFTEAGGASLISILSEVRGLSSVVAFCSFRVCLSLALRRRLLLSVLAAGFLAPCFFLSLSALQEGHVNS